MKVLEQGKGTKSWSVEVRCTGSGNGDGGCGAKLLAETSDLFRTSSSHYDGSTDTYVTVECPECKVWTDLKRYPNHILDLLPHRSPNRRESER